MTTDTEIQEAETLLKKLKEKKKEDSKSSLKGTIGHVLYTCRSKKGLTQAAVVKTLGIKSPSFLSHIEGDRVKDPGIGTVRAIAEACDYTLPQVAKMWIAHQEELEQTKEEPLSA